MILPSSLLLCLAAATLTSAASSRAHSPAGDASICEVLHKDWECTADEACAWSKELRHCDEKGASASLHPRAASASAAAAPAPTHSPPPSAAAPASAAAPVSTAAPASPDASAPFDAHPGVPDNGPRNEASASSADSTTPTSSGLRGAAASSGGPDHHAPAGSKFASFFRKLAKVRGASKGDEHHESHQDHAAAASPEGSKEAGKEKEKDKDKEAVEDDGNPCGSSSPPNPGMSEVVPSHVSAGESPSTSSFVELHRRHRRHRRHRVRAGARAGCEEEKELVKTNFLWQRIFKNKPYVPLPSRTHTFVEPLHAHIPPHSFTAEHAYDSKCFV